MTAPNTSREAVEALASNLEPVGWEEVCPHCQEYRFPALPDAAAMLRALLDRAEAAERERDEFQSSSTLRWRADMRAINRWKEQHPTRKNVWPDHADLVVWLLAALDAARADALREAADVARKVRIDGDCHHNEAHGRLTGALAASDAILALIEQEAARDE